MLTAAPPLASPSNLVKMVPDSFKAAENASAELTAS